MLLVTIIDAVRTQLTAQHENSELSKQISRPAFTRWLVECVFEKKADG